MPSIDDRSPPAGRLRRRALLSLALWLAVVAATWLYLAWAASREPGSGDRFGAGGDSILLPTVAVGVWVALALVAINLVAAVVSAARRRRHERG